MLDARSKWLDLGFQLDIKLNELRVIEKDCGDVNSRFREMLSTWLKMIDPPPSWEGLLTALEHDTVKCGDLAERIRQEFDMRKKTNWMKQSVFKRHKVPSSKGTKILTSIF